MADMILAWNNWRINEIILSIKELSDENGSGNKICEWQACQSMPRIVSL